VKLERFLQLINSAREIGPAGGVLFAFACNATTRQKQQDPGPEQHDPDQKEIRDEIHIYAIRSFG
jgi:hypothetical protein